MRFNVFNELHSDGIAVFFIWSESGCNVVLSFLPSWESVELVFVGCIVLASNNCPGLWFVLMVLEVTLPVFSLVETVDGNFASVVSFLLSSWSQMHSSISFISHPQNYQSFYVHELLIINVLPRPRSNNKRPVMLSLLQSPFLSFPALQKV